MLERSEAPPFNKIHKIAIRQPSHTRLANGVDLFTVQSGSQPVIKVDLIFKTGKFQELTNGIAFFAGKMLSEGVAGKSSKDISELIDSYGAHLEITPGIDRLEITLYSLTKHLDNLLILLKELITLPTIPQPEFETLKNIRLQSLRINNEKNDFVATKVFRKTLFGEDHPYGSILTEEDINKVDAKMVADHVRKHIVGKPFTIVASGYYVEDVTDKIQDTFETIVLSDEDVSPSVAINGSSSDEYQEKEQSVQTSIRMGMLTIPMGHPDYHKLAIMNELLGGYFGSRLMKNIREEKGLTYGIYSGLVNLDAASYFVISADVMKSNKDEAIKEILLEVRELHQSLVNQEELDTVKNVILGQIQSSVNTPFELASKFKSLHFRGLTYDYYDQLFETIQSITPEMVQQIARKYLDTSSFRTVTVG